MQEGLATDRISADLTQAVLPDSVGEMGFVCLGDLQRQPDVDLAFAADHVRDARTVIVIVKPLRSALLQQAPDESYQKEAASAFGCLRRCAEAMTKWLEKSGHRSVWPGSQKVKHQKRLAVAAGLGEIGDHTLFVSYRYGPGVHLETIVSSVAVRGAGLRSPPSGLCLHCSRCQEACPSGALDNGDIDRSKCSAFRHTHLGGGYCGICMKVCAETGAGRGRDA